MVWEFPAVSHTRIEVWKKPQFTRKGMWWFTLFFGMFGLHHLLLRSPQTTILFCIANFLSFGYCYFYDLIQLSEKTFSGLGTEGLNKYGLSHPWGPLGLAKGMWIPDPDEPSSSQGAQESGSLPSPKEMQEQAQEAHEAAIKFPPALKKLTETSQEDTKAAKKLRNLDSEADSFLKGGPAAPVSGMQAPPTPGGLPPEIAAMTQLPPPPKAAPYTGPQGPGFVPPKNGIQYSSEVQPMVGGGDSGDSGSETPDPPSPWFFFLYSLLLPLAPLALALAGDNKNALSRFLFLTIVPLGFVLYAGSLVYDYWLLLSQPSEVALFGAKRFFPFTVLGMDKDGHSPYLTGKEERIGCPPANNLQMLLRMVLPLLRFFFPELADGLETAMSTAQTVKTQVVDRGIAAGKQAIETGQQFKATADTLITKVPEAVSKAQQIASNPQSLVPKAVMVGGGTEQSSPLLQGLTIGSLVAVVGGGLLLQASRSFSTWTNDRTDSPPLPRRV